MRYSAPMLKPKPVNDTATAALLSYTSGFVDTLSFVALFGLFAAHVTGNFVLIATSVAEERHGLWMKVLAVPVFILAAVGTRLFIIRRNYHSRDAAAQVLLAQSLVLLLFMGLATANAPLRDHNKPIVIVIGLIAAAAMAIQNTAARTFLSHLPPTTVMTGNLMQIIVDGVDLLYGRGDLETQRARLKRLAPMLTAFILGTLSGAAGYLTVGFPCLIVPALIVAFIGSYFRSLHTSHG